MAQQNPVILGISHVAVKGKDVNKSMAFYHDFLGFDEEFRLYNKSNQSVLQLVAFKVNDFQWLEVFDNSNNIGGNALFQVSLRYQDDEVFRNYLKSKGYSVPNALTMGQMKNYNFMQTDPNGYALEYQQYLVGGKTFNDAGKFMPASRISDHISQISILAKDTAASIHFYSDILGLKEVWRSTPDSKSSSLIDLQIPNSKDRIELIVNGVAGDENFCLEVPDIDKAKSKLERTAYFKLYAKPIKITTAKNNKRQFILTDPDGFQIKVVENKL
jgi:lactoylglutathione lyase